MNLKNMFFTGLFTMTILSCSKNDDSTPVPPEPENAPPTVSFVTPTNSSGPLWNMVEVELNAVDADGDVAKVEFFVNGAKEAEMTAAPYTFNWNSKNSSDGAVELKATVTDDEGGTATASIMVNVMNVLLDYNLFDGYLDSGDNIINFTYITGPAPEKEILYIAEITGSTFGQVVQRPADFDGETFDVHLVEYVKGDNNKGEITTYHGITPGDFHPVPKTPTNFGNELGQANVTFTNVPGHDYALIFSGGNTNPIVEGTERSFTIYDNFDLGYVYLQNGGAGFYLAPPFSADDHVLALNEMNSSMQSYTFTDNGVNATASFLVQGHTSSGRFSPAVTVYRRNVVLGGAAFETNFHTPRDEDEVFDHYYTNVRLQSGGKTFVHEAYNEVLTSMVKMDATFEANNKTMSQLDITANSTADFDFLYMTSQIAASGTFDFKWNSYSADDNVSFPPIPTEVFEATNGVFNASDIAFKEANITFLLEDLDNYNGYSDYRDIQFGRLTETERNERIYVFEIF